MMKAFDRVSWPFLRAVLDRFRFLVALINLVMNTLEATQLSVLINGVSCGFFQPTRGVKQGDPLSPLLFILASESLSCSLILKMGTGKLAPYSSRINCPIATHLAFADDIVIFVNGSSDGKPKRHWVTWRKVCLATNKGGLGVRCLASIQDACSAKLHFNFLKGGTLWSSYMHTRYLDVATRQIGSLTWRRMQFLKDFVEDNISTSSGVLVWTPSVYDSFTFSSAYDSLRPKAGRCLSSSSVRGDLIPAKISMFMWRLLRKLLPFPNILESFGFSLPSICLLCKSASASLEHCVHQCCFA
ncbi:PREDICTED: uncharacterized protein LOC109157410 [Ipomoea nil]|uniref:uncharacterized protein LOC109157410 n=1 Tax=Ipomoea nil TaxID=35883 RepID=UPI0009017F2E|nr:PREDICTED: uncharacterized protein LOC109157410 [Ipomoea nil]